MYIYTLNNIDIGYETYDTCHSSDSFMFNDRAIFTWIRIATSDLGAKAVLSGTVLAQQLRFLGGTWSKR